MPQMEMETAIVWRPHLGPQEAFHQIPAYEALFGGTKGPGKTDTLLREGLRQIDNPNYRAIIFRRTFPRLGEIIDRSFKYFKKLGATYSDHDIQLKLPSWTFHSGARYCFGHVQHERDKYNYQGKEFHYMGFDQIEEFTESQYLFLMAQNRTSDPNIWCYIRSTANPGGIGHAWVKKRWIDCLKPCELKYFKRVDDEDIECDSSDPRSVSRAFVPATVYDNPSIIENDPNYIRRLEQLPEQEKKALLYGDWDVFKGQFFSMWRKSIHVVDREVLPSFEKFLSLDYGYGAPASVGWWMVDFDGRMHRYREFYGEGFTYEKLAMLIKQMTPREELMNYCVADPAIWGDKSHHKLEVEGESGAETMNRIWRGFTGLMKADNNRITGWGRMRIMLTPHKNEFGELESNLTCDPSCKNSIRTIPSLIHDDFRVEDLDTEGEDHCADDWRYSLMSRPQTSLKPKPRSYDPAIPLAGELIGSTHESEFDKWMQ